MLITLRGDIQKRLASFGKPHEDEEIDKVCDISDVSAYAQKLAQKNKENEQLLRLRMREWRADNLIVVNDNEERVVDDSIQGDIWSSLSNRGKEGQESEVELEIRQEESEENRGRCDFLFRCFNY